MASYSWLIKLEVWVSECAWWDCPDLWTIGQEIHCDWNSSLRHFSDPSAAFVLVNSRTENWQCWNALVVCVCVCSGVHGVGGRGARAPAPLRSDAKVPLRSGLCDMNDTICSVCCLYRAPSQLLKKINKYVTRHARARDRRSHLMFAAEAYDHNWTTITPPPPPSGKLNTHVTFR